MTQCQLHPHRVHIHAHYLHNQHFLHDKMMQLWCLFQKFKNALEILKKQLLLQNLPMKNLISTDDNPWHQSDPAKTCDESWSDFQNLWLQVISRWPNDFLLDYMNDCGTPL